MRRCPVKCPYSSVIRPFQARLVPDSVCPMTAKKSPERGGPHMGSPTSCAVLLNSRNPTNGKTRHFKRMKTYLSIAGILLCLAFAPGAFAQVNGDQNDNSMLYQPNVDLTSLSQNQFSGIVGGQIITPYYNNVSVNYLGYADPLGAALTSSHTITIWGAAGYSPGGGGYGGPAGSVVAS